MASRVIETEDTPDTLQGVTRAGMSYYSNASPSELLISALRLKPTKIVFGELPSFIFKKIKNKKFRKKKLQIIRIKGTSFTKNIAPLDKSPDIRII